MNKNWTQEEKDFISTNYMKMSDHDIAKELGRTFRSVRIQRQRQGLFLYFQEDCSPIKGEIWKSIDDRLEISNKGRVRKDKTKYLKLHIHKTGYVTVSINSKLEYIHRIMWETFVGSVPDGYELDHIDCNKQHNILSNLELVTHQENMKRAYHNGCFNNFCGLGVSKR